MSISLTQALRPICCLFILFCPAVGKRFLPTIIPLTCGKSFTTREKIDWDGVVLVQSEGSDSPYSRERLLLSLVRASQNLELGPGTISDLCDATEHQLQKNNFFNARKRNSELITATTMQVLQRFDTNLALQYINCVYRSKPPIELLKQLTDI